MSTVDDAQADLTLAAIAWRSHLQSDQRDMYELRLLNAVDRYLAALGVS